MRKLLFVLCFGTYLWSRYRHAYKGRDQAGWFVLYFHMLPIMQDTPHAQRLTYYGDAFFLNTFLDSKDHNDIFTRSLPFHLACMPLEQVESPSSTLVF